MHDCYECGAACYCDLEDHLSETQPDDCMHVCPAEEEDIDE